MADQPNSAPTDLKNNAAAADARDDATASAVVRDTGTEGRPGGGGLMGGDEPGDAMPDAVGGASPNAPIDTGVSAGDAGADAEARRRSTDETTR